MNSGKGVYLEGTNIGFDHAGTDFWDMFGATYMGQGQEHGDIETVSGFDGNFAVSMNYSYQSYSYADIFINRLGTNGGDPVLLSEEMYNRTVAYSNSVYNAISSAVLFGALGDGEGLSRKVDLMRLYLAFLLKQEEPDIWTSDQVLDFDFVLIGNQAERQLIIQNSGLEQLNIESISLNNEYFTLEADSIHDLSFGDNIFLNISFDGTETGIFESELQIVTNDPDNPVLNIPVQVNCFEPQMIVVEPEEINLTLGQNESEEIDIAVNNLGGGVLDYQTVIYSTEENSRNSGGPDQFGYYWRDSDDADGPEYEWFDISEIGDNLGITDVNSHADVYLPFPFHFYGNIYENMAVSSNGYLTFGNNADDQSNDQIPFVIDPDNLIAPLWDYLAPGFGSVHSYYDDISERFIIQYTDWRFYISGGLSSLTFQVQMFSNGNIRFIYNTLEGDLTSCTVGIENENASDGLPIAYNEEYLQNAMAIEIFFQPDWLELDHYMGSVLHDEPDHLMLSLNSNDLPAGTYLAEIQIHSNDTHNSLLVVPVTMNVDFVDAPDEEIVSTTKLLGNYPNPFNPVTTISFSVENGVSGAELGIYNIRGQLVKTYSIDTSHEQNTYSVIWDGTDDKGNAISSGIYFSKLRAGKFTDSRKMILMK